MNMLHYFLQAGIIISLSIGILVAMLSGEITHRDVGHKNPWRSFLAIFFARTKPWGAWKWIAVAAVLYGLHVAIYKPDISPGGFYDDPGPVVIFSN
jgi:uncharacterized membrane protein (DUF441 family)